MKLSTVKARTETSAIISFDNEDCYYEITYESTDIVVKKKALMTHEVVWQALDREIYRFLEAPQDAIMRVFILSNFNWLSTLDLVKT